MITAYGTVMITVIYKSSAYGTSAYEIVMIMDICHSSAYGTVMNTVILSVIDRFYTALLFTNDLRMGQ